MAARPPMSRGPAPGGPGGAVPAGSARPVSVAGPIQTDGANFYNYAVVSNEGVLFEDDVIQIGYQVGSQRELGRLVLFYGNFTNEKMNLTTALSAEGMTVQPVGPLPSLLEPKKQVQQQLNITNNGEFVEPPLIKVNYGVAGKNFQKVLKLPLSVNKFISPLQINEQEFLKMWTESPAEKQYVVDTKAPCNIPYAAQVLVEGFRLAITPGSWAQTNVVAAGTFFSSAGPVNVLLRLEVSTTTPLYRITVRSTSAAITNSLSNLLQVHFGVPTTI